MVLIMRECVSAVSAPPCFGIVVKQYYNLIN
jgi:hypothetical protein